MTTPEHYDFHDEDADPEAFLLAALMRTRDVVRIQHATEMLTAADFYDASHAAIFATMRSQVAQHRPCDAASIRSALFAEGEQSGIHPDAIDSLITMLISLDVNDFHLHAYLHQVAGLSYRRQFARMADRLANVAATAPETDLYDLLVKEGKHQRKAWEHYRNLAEPDPHKDNQKGH